MAIGTTAAILGASAIGAGSSIIAGNKAAGAARDAASAQSATDRYIFDTAREDNAPWREVGTGALGKLAQFYGIKAPDSISTDWNAYARQPGIGDYYASHNGQNLFTQGDSMSLEDYAKQHYDTYGKANGIDMTPFQSKQTGSADPYSGFTASPGYQFRMDQGLKAIERSAAARGGLRSGATMKSLNDYAQGTASDEYARYTGNLFQLAGFGQQANQANQQAGAQFAANQGQTNAQMGAARASAYANTGNAINSTVGNLAGMYLYTQGYGSKAAAKGYN